MDARRRERSEGKGTSPRTRGRPSADTVAQIDREILEAARALFFSKGYEGTSMAMIGKAAAVSKTTLYARYDTKAALFRATVRLTVDRIENLVLSPGEEAAEDLAQGLLAFGRGAITISLLPLWANYERLVYAEGLRFPELANTIAEQIDLGIGSVSRFIRACAERDGIACRDPEAIATTYVMALRGFLSAATLRAHKPEEQDSDEFVSKLVATLVASRASW